MKKKLLIISITIAICAATALYFLVRNNSAPEKDTTQTAHADATSTTEDSGKSTFDKTKYSLTDPTSLWVVVNKSSPLNPQTYVPDDLVEPAVSLRIPGAEQMQLRAAAASALEKMFAAASADGIELQITTAFRGYNYQSTLYNGYVNTQGQAVADSQSARPGYSEHQTGWAADIRSASSPNECYLEICFSEMEEGKWLAAHAHEYGFLLRYPADKTDVTGYSYEPWHFRYIGTELASEMHQQGVTTLEEFFSLGSAPDYE